MMVQDGTTRSISVFSGMSQGGCKRVQEKEKTRSRADSVNEGVVKV